MTDAEILICRKALGLLADLGPQGLGEDDLREQTQLACGRPLTTQDLDVALREMRERKWIASYTQSLTGRVRWYATDAGLVARNGL